MKLNHVTLAALLMAAFAAPAAFAQANSIPQSPSREAVRAEAISSYKDGTMVHGEMAPKATAFQSTKTRKEVSAEAIRSHQDGTMMHNEAGPVAR
jgi:CBS domain containing-hemolysin-like protein